MAGMCPFFLSCWRGVSGVGLPARLAGGMCACGSMGCVGWCLKRAEGPTCFSARGVARPFWRVFRVSALQGQQERKVCVSFALSGREFDVWLFPPGRLPWAERFCPFRAYLACRPPCSGICGGGSMGVRPMLHGRGCPFFPLAGRIRHVAAPFRHVRGQSGH